MKKAHTAPSPMMKEEKSKNLTSGPAPAEAPAKVEATPVTVAPVEAAPVAAAPVAAE